MQQIYAFGNSLIDVGYNSVTKHFYMIGFKTKNTERNHPWRSTDKVGLLHNGTPWNS